MKRLLIFIIALLFVSACKKLDKKDFYLENNCSSCEKSLKKDILDIKGIYYAEYDWKAGRLTIKYDPNEFKSGILYDQLQKKHFLRSLDSLNTNNTHLKPYCCEE